MKVTKERLTRIIKEELEAMMGEGYSGTKKYARSRNTESSTRLSDYNFILLMKPDSKEALSDLRYYEIKRENYTAPGS